MDPHVAVRASGASASSSSIATAPEAIQDGMTLRCAFAASARVRATPKKMTGEITEDQEGTPGSLGTVDLLVVDRRLVIVGPDGGEKLILAGKNREKGAMFFVERTPTGNVVLWSFYPLKDGRVIFMKQNNYGLGSTADDGLSAWNHAGYCSVTRGNAEPLSQ